MNSAMVTKYRAYYFISTLLHERCHCRTHHLLPLVYTITCSIWRNSMSYRAWEHIATLIKHILSRIFHQLNVTIVAMHCLLPQRSCLLIQTTIYYPYTYVTLHVDATAYIFSYQQAFSKRCHETPSPTVERLYQPCQSNKDAQQRITKHTKQCMPCAHRPELVKHGGDTLISYSTVTWCMAYVWNFARKLVMYIALIIYR